MPQIPFCDGCGNIQDLPDGLTYFNLFGLSQTLKLDEEALRDHYYELSRKLHPDRYATAVHPIPSYAAKWTTFLNRAYQTLLGRVPRSLYVLELTGHTQDDKAPQVPTELAEQYFDLQELLMESKEVEPILLFREDLLERLQANELEWELLADRWTKEPKESLAASLQENLTKGRYLKSMIADLGKKIGTPHADSGN